MTYLITGYISIGVCYATAAWKAFSADPKHKAQMAALNWEKVPVKVVFVLLLAPLLAAIALTWPFNLLTRLFFLLIRKSGF